MADLKISQLPSATTPLAGTEVLPIVQSSATKQVSIANLTAGRSVSVADATLTTGNLVIGTAGKGIDFSATTGAGTSELLADYEEGTWTPSDASGAGLTFTGISADYTKVGRLVTCQASFNFPATASAAPILIAGLPFSAAGVGSVGTSGFNSAGFQIFLRQNSPTTLLAVNSTNITVTNASMSSTLVIIGFSYRT